MRLDALPVSFALCLLLYVDHTLAAPSPHDQSPSSQARGLHIPILRRATVERDDSELGRWAKEQKLLLETKYGGASTTKRATGQNLCA
jgi:hypothetical protein